MQVVIWNLKAVKLRLNNLFHNVIKARRFYLTGSLNLKYKVISDKMVCQAFSNLLTLSTFDKDLLYQLPSLRMGREGS